MDMLADPHLVAHLGLSLLTLTGLEIVLGIDNLIFIALLVDRVEPGRRAAARRAGLSLALISRLALLGTLAWMIGLTRPVVTLWGHGVSWRDLVLMAGGLFLLAKATLEIHARLEGDEGARAVRAAGFWSVVGQIMVLDIIFSLDSIITAVGMSGQLWVMATAVVLAVIVMLMAAGPLSDFIARHPTVKMLALSFLLLVGFSLIAEGAGFSVPKGYLYAAMGFSVFVEGLNLAARRRAGPPVTLRPALEQPSPAEE